MPRVERLDATNLVRIVLFRCDASPAIGGGHIARCDGLAGALRANGCWCVFAVAAECAATTRIAHADEIVLLDGSPADTDLLARFVRKAHLVVVDHYADARSFAAWARKSGLRIATFDDAAAGEEWADVLIDLSPPPEDVSVLEVQRGRLWLRGPGWAPLLPSFAQLRPNMRREAGPMARALIAIGATDPTDITPAAIVALRRAGFTGAIDVALSSQATHLARVRDTCASHDASLHVNTASMAELIANSDLVIGGAGISSWERAALGKVSIALVVADNQARNAAALAREDAAEIVTATPGVDVAALAGAVRRILTDSSCARRRAARSIALTDGRGARRLALALDPPRAHDGRAVCLRPVRRADMTATYEWQIRPGARRYSRNPMAPEWQEHVDWFEGKLVDPRCVLSIISVDGNDAGLLRLDPAAPMRFEVSILVADGFQGGGVGRAALAGAARLAPEADLLAHVAPANDRSISLFKRSGYRLIGNDNYMRPALQGVCNHD